MFEITGIAPLISRFSAGSQVEIRAVGHGQTTEFKALVRIDTPQEALYYANGGILQYVLRQLLAGRA
jgi:aconitate hydratase